jgi:hypothetical protein
MSNRTAISSGKNRRKSQIGVVFFGVLFLFLCVFPGSATAQVLYGSLTGNVTDPSEAVLPGARVEALNTDTGVARTTTTNEHGLYSFSELMPGTYKLTVLAANFGTRITDGIRVTPNAVARVDVRLELKTQIESVTVTSAPPLLQTDKADLHTDLTATQIENLPISSSQGRSFQSLYKLIPGSGLPTEANSPAGNPQRAISVNTNGQSIQTNNTRIDGATMAYPWLPQNIAYVPPADAIESVNITTNSFDAEQGAAGGAAVSVQIKSGTNQLHGSLHEFHHDSSLEARDFFFPKTITIGGVTSNRPKNKNVQNQFGGTVGGPIKKDKLFFFGDYERTLQRIDAVPNGAQSVFGDASPSSPGYYQKLRSGDFSGIPTVIYDPATGNPDGTGRKQISCNGVLNVICPNRLDSAAMAFLKRVPAPNLVTANGLNNYYVALAAPYTRDTFDVKLNYVPSNKSMVFGRYSFSQSHIFDPPVLGAAGGGAINGGSAGNADGRIQSVGLGATYTFTPALLADWNFGYTRQHLGALNVDLGKNVGLDELGIPGTNGPSFLEGGIPFLNFATSAGGSALYSNMGNADTGNPFLFRDNQWVTNANLSWTKGKHSFRFGIEVDRAAINHFQPQGGTFGTARGSLNYNGNVTVNPSSAGASLNSNQYNSFAAFLLGYASTVGKATQTTAPIALRWTTWAAYARDQFQITPKFTFNYGVRWEFFPIGTSDNGRGLRYFDANPSDSNFGKVVIGGIGGVPITDGVDTGHGQFLPRVGIAYRLTNKTVIRAGYGMNADANNWRFFRNNYPNIIATQINGNTSYPGLTPTTSATYIPAACTTGNQATNTCAHPLPNYPGLQVGVPAISVPDIANQGVLSLPNTLGTNTIANPFHRGYIHSFNLTLQREFAGFVGEAGYVGARAIRPLALIQLNTGTIGGGQNSGVYNILLHQTSSDPCFTAQNTPQNPFAKCANTLGIGAYTPFKNSYYDSLQTKLTRRFGGSSQIGVVYTFQKAISYSDDEELQSTLFTLPSAYQLNKGPARFDRTHNFQLYGVYEMPFGKGKRWATHGVANIVAGGWQWNGVFSHLSGTPFTVTANNNLNAPGSGTDSADLIGPVHILNGTPAGGGATCLASDLSCHYFDPTAFAAPPSSRYGNTNRDFLRGPSFTNLDLSLFRNFKITERLGFQFRAEAFSLTNTPHFANPNANVSNAANFGIITSTIGGRSGTNLNGARQIWFGGKLTF